MQPPGRCGRGRLAGVSEGGRRAWVAGLVVGLSLAGAGCASGSKTADAPAPSPTSVTTDRSDVATSDASVPYALLEADGWTLQDAVDWPPGNILAGVEPVPSDWWSEYQRLEYPGGGVTVSQGVKVTGFAAGLDAYRQAMERVLFTFRTVETASGEGLVATSADPVGPAIVAVPLGGGTLELLSYDLTTDELVALVARTRTVDLDAWRAAGGKVG